MAKARRPSTLLLGSRYDLSLDYVVAQLRRRGIEYLRINTEDLAAAIVELDPVEGRLTIQHSGASYIVTASTLSSVLFRRPVFLRDYGDDDRTPAEQFSRIQWASFIRGLALFSDARWINDPAATYKAEHKAIQLFTAAKLGFAVPDTRFTNAPRPDSVKTSDGRVALKGIDTVLLRTGGFEMFGFTRIVDAASLNASEWRSAPATVQAALERKLDVRVTVVRDQVFSVSITAGGHPIPGDWRAQKGLAEFRREEVPKEIASRCRQLVGELALTFGAIDLALCGGEYYFLELNPTGEWAWLVDATGLPIDEAIGDALRP